MRRLLKWIALTVGLVALARWLRERREAPWPEPGGAADPAEELRQKLAESRGGDEPMPADDAGVAATVEERRADVHEEARATLAEMSPPDEP